VLPELLQVMLRVLQARAEVLPVVLLQAVLRVLQAVLRVLQARAEVLPVVLQARADVPPETLLLDVALLLQAYLPYGSAANGLQDHAESCLVCATW